MAFRQSAKRIGKAVERSTRVAWRLHVGSRLNDLRYGHIPTAMITGSNGKTTTSRLLAAILKRHGHVVGLACTDGIYVDGVPVTPGDYAGYRGAVLLFRRHRITAAVLETARGGLLGQGLFMRRRKVGALLNVGAEHIGVGGIVDLDQMAALKSLVIKDSRIAILNADDPRCARIAAAQDPRRVILFASDLHSPLVQSMVAAGARAVSADPAGYMVLTGAAVPTPRRLARIADIPVTQGGTAGHYVADAMAAAALAVALDVPPDAIGNGLAGFRGGVAENPGRWNSFEGYPFTLIAERGMNSPGFTATARTVAAMAVKGRRLLLLGAVGNRTNEHYRQLAALAAPVFDSFVVYDNLAYLRGRKPGEVPALLCSALAESGVAEDRVERAPNVVAGMARISARARPGDLVLLLVLQLPGLEPELRRAFAAHHCSGNDTGERGVVA